MLNLFKFLKNNLDCRKKTAFENALFRQMEILMKEKEFLKKFL